MKSADQGDMGMLCGVTPGAYMALRDCEPYPGRVGKQHPPSYAHYVATMLWLLRLSADDVS
eukprot:CAMPEP_0117668322 /NCGR_PEP_ID=MMETSP0804-20121206/11482_1 /TAXON_ID=1074897 /ORGANISM="Tetraselmis astigmatica, Strain CCMP880" /LENGTH=60 /DNA_ID=CAMNT_0005476195 /DNA_START=56 /DNA_END=238 /DNA_ORIENTATION=-